MISRGLKLQADLKSDTNQDNEVEKKVFYDKIYNTDSNFSSNSYLNEQGHASTLEKDGLNRSKHINEIEEHVLWLGWLFKKATEETKTIDKFSFAHILNNLGLTYKLRFFVLTNQTLSYYASPSDIKEDLLSSYRDLDELQALLSSLKYIKKGMIYIKDVISFEKLSDRNMQILTSSQLLEVSILNTNESSNDLKELKNYLYHAQGITRASIADLSSRLSSTETIKWIGYLYKKTTLQIESSHKSIRINTKQLKLTNIRNNLGLTYKLRLFILTNHGLYYYAGSSNDINTMLLSPTDLNEFQSLLTSLQYIKKGMVNINDILSFEKVSDRNIQISTPSQILELSILNNTELSANIEDLLIGLLQLGINPLGRLTLERSSNLSEINRRGSVIDGYRDKVNVKARKRYGCKWYLKNGHKKEITSIVMYTPIDQQDGVSPMIITGSEDGCAIAWDFISGEIHQIFTNDTFSPIIAVLVCPSIDIQSPVILITVSSFERTILWNLMNGEMIRILTTGHSDLVTCAALYNPIIYESEETSNQDNNVNEITGLSEPAPPLLCTGSDDTSAVVWNLLTGEKIHSLQKGHSRGITSIITHSFIDTTTLSTSSFVITGSKDRTVAVWDLSTGELIRVIETKHTLEITAIALYTQIDGISSTLVITGSSDKSLIFSDFTSGANVRTLKNVHQDSITSIAIYSPTNIKISPLVITGSKDKTISVQDLRSGKTIRSLQDGHTSAISAVAIYFPTLDQPILPVIISGSWDYNAIIWDFAPVDKVLTLKDGHSDYIFSVAVTSSSSDDSSPLILTGSKDQTCVIWDLRTGEIVGTLIDAQNDWITSIAIYSPTKKSFSPLVVTGSRFKKAIVWDLRTGEIIRTLINGHTDWITSVVIYIPTDKDSPPLVVTGSRDETAIIWNLMTGDIIHILRKGGHTDWINSIAIYTPLDMNTSPLVCTCSSDKTAIIWDLLSGTMIRVLRNGHTSSITSIAVYSSHKKNVSSPPLVITAGSDDKLIILWNLNTGEIMRIFKGGHYGSINALAIYDDSKDLNGSPFIITGSSDCTVLVWDLFSGDIVYAFKDGHKDIISSIAVYVPYDGKFSPLVITGSWDSTAIVWALNKSGNKILPMNFEIKQQMKRNTSTISKLLNNYYHHFGASFLIENMELIFEYLMMSNGDHLEGIEFNLKDIIHRFPFIEWYNHKGEKCKKSILFIFIKTNSSKARYLQLVLNSWIEALNSDCKDYLDYEYHPCHNLDIYDLIELSKVYPSDFINFICKLRIIEVKHMKESLNSYIISSKFDNIIEGMPRLKVIDGGWSSFAGYIQTENPKALPITTLMIPLNNAAHSMILDAYVNVSVSLDNIDIFNSEVGINAFQYAWISFGKYIHVKATFIYVTFLCLFSCSIYLFDRMQKSSNHSHVRFAWLLQAIVFLFCIYDVISELKQISNEINAYKITYKDTRIRKHRKKYESKINEYQLIDQIQYYIYSNFDYLSIRILSKLQLIIPIINHFSNIWNLLDLVVMVFVSYGTILRCSNGEETNHSRSLLAIASVLVWLKLLYYLRAFKESGPLVSMILHIILDIRYFILILGFALAGFSQAFWLISYPNISDDFGTIQKSFYNIYLYMFVQISDTDFSSTASPKLGALLLVLFLLFIVILMLNLLIALMGSTFQKVQDKGYAQWRLEQASIMQEQRFMRNNSLMERHNEYSYIHIMKYTSTVEKERLHNTRNKEINSSKDDIDLIQQKLILFDHNLEEKVNLIDKKVINRINLLEEKIDILLHSFNNNNNNNIQNDQLKKGNRIFNPIESIRSTGKIFSIDTD